MTGINHEHRILRSILDFQKDEKSTIPMDKLHRNIKVTFHRGVDKLYTMTMTINEEKVKQDSIMKIFSIVDTAFTEKSYITPYYIEHIAKEEGDEHTLALLKSLWGASPAAGFEFDSLLKKWATELELDLIREMLQNEYGLVATGKKIRKPGRRKEYYKQSESELYHRQRTQEIRACNRANNDNSIEYNELDPAWVGKASRNITTCSLPGMDKYNLPYYGGSFVVLAGPTGHGKSTLLAHEATIQAYKKKLNVLYYSFEEEAERILFRIHICRANGVRREHGMKKLISSTMAYKNVDNLNHPIVKEIREVSELKHGRLTVRYAPGISIDQLYSDAIQYADETGGLDILIVDYIGIMHESSTTSKNENETYKVMRAKELAMKLNCTLITAAQISRQGKETLQKGKQYGKTIELSSIAWSAEYENSASLAITFNSEDIGDNVKNIDLAVKKFRDGAPPPVTHIQYDFDAKVVEDGFEFDTGELPDDFGGYS